MFDNDPVYTGIVLGKREWDMIAFLAARGMFDPFANLERLYLQAVAIDRNSETIMRVHSANWSLDR